MRADFGNLYIERYWNIDDALLIEPKDEELHRHHRHRYIRLFEDEFDVANLGFLDARQWEAWHSLLDDPKQLARATANRKVDLTLLMNAWAAESALGEAGSFASGLDRPSSRVNNRSAPGCKHRGKSLQVSHTHRRRPPIRSCHLYVISPA